MTLFLLRDAHREHNLISSPLDGAIHSRPQHAYDGGPGGQASRGRGPVPGWEVGGGIKSGNGRSYESGDEIYQQGAAPEFCYVVTSGWAALLTLLDNGRRQVFDFATPGSFIGFRPYLRHAMSHTALCLTPITACRIPHQRILDALSAQPAFGMRLVEVTSHHEDRVRDHLASIACRDARGRITRLMVELFHRVKHRLPDRAGDSVNLPLTLPLIGDALGLTNVHVSRTLRVLREDGILSFSNHDLRILDPEAVIREAGYEGEIFEPPSDLPYGEIMTAVDTRQGAML